MIAATFPKPAQTRMADQLWPMAGFALALGVMAAAAMVVDGRILDGANVWAKPLKFATSFVVYFTTLALVTDRLGATARTGWTLRIAVAAAIVAMLGEMAYISFMAGQGARSHFNFSAPIFVTMYQIMGLGSLMLVLAVAAVGVVAWRDRDAAMGPGLRLGVLTGFVGSTLLTLITAGTLASNAGHFVGVPPDGAAVLPLFGWSASVGDLRPAHFLALHMMQAVPLLGLAVDRLGLGRAAVLPGVLAYAALTGAVFWQALLGLPLIRL